MLLTPGAVTRINSGEKLVCLLHVKAIRPVIVEGGISRYRVLLSDGQSDIQGMFSASQNQLFTNNTIVKNSIIEISDFLKYEVSGQTVIVPLSIKVVG